MKHHSLSKVLKRLACVLAALIIALAVAVFALWHNELATISSLKKLSDRDEAHRDGAVYQLNVSGGYYFDDFLAQGGASTDSELISFITQSITKGIIPMNIKTSTIACSAFTADTQSGDRVFGRNYDFSATNTAIVYTNPGKGRHASYSTIDLSFLGLDKDKDVESLGQKILTLAAPYVPLDGVNDAGVACGIFMSYQGEGKGTPTDTQTDKPDLTSTTLLRLILDYADSVEDAVALATDDDVHQILYNLMENAIKYSAPENGYVHAEAHVDGQRVVITVSDNGIGIPDEDLPHVFDRFYRVDKMRSREVGGTGLGLSIVKDTIENRGGTIEAGHGADGVGTVFTVYLPLAERGDEA